MPSYARNQFLDMDDLLCKQLLSLDMGVLSQTSASAVGYKNLDSSCTLSSASEPRQGTSHWAQPKESQWNKTGFWSDRSISMVEGDVGGLGWASDNSASMTNEMALASSTSLLSPSTASSRYKTELCRTFTERGVCKYGIKCQFAHGQEELRDINRHPKYKTEPCRTFHSIGFCPYGIRCHFVHNNDDDVRHRPHPISASTRRPQLLKQSFSFAGFPTTHRPLDPPLTHSPFRSMLSTSPPSKGTISDLLTLAFRDLSPSSAMDQTCDPLLQFFPSPDSGCSQGESTPTISPSQMVPGINSQCPLMGTRSLSLTSLSDHEGCCSSSASSLSGSDFSSAPDAAARRLPIFSQLSVPDDGFCSEGSASFFL